MGTASYLWRPMETRRPDLGEWPRKSSFPIGVETQQRRSEQRGKFDGWVDAADTCGQLVAAIQFRACNRSGTVLNCGG